MAQSASRKLSKIQGVSFPALCPRDFADQVRSVVRRHNQLIDDLLTYQHTIKEFQTINKELTEQLDTKTQETNQLRAENNRLKILSDKVASKYEALVSKSPDSGIRGVKMPTRTIRGHKSAQIDEPVNRPHKSASEFSSKPANTKRPAFEVVDPEPERDEVVDNQEDEEVERYSPTMSDDAGDDEELIEIVSS